MRAAVIGYGGVGRAFVKLLKDKEAYIQKEGLQIQLIYIIGRNGGIYDPGGIDLKAVLEFEGKDITKYPLGGSPEITFHKMLENRDVDMVIELTPTNMVNGEPGMTHIRRSLECGINVVTGNKGPILLAYKDLSELAANKHVQLGIGCTTGGALPSISAGIVDFAGSSILSIEGVLNGTTNFIINEMENTGTDYMGALKKAQQLGIAETDPALDVEGWDTAAKLVIITNVLMKEQKSLKDVTVEGITKITPQEIKNCLNMGYKYKLMGRAVKEKGEVKITVKPEMLAPDHPLYGVNGKNKALRYVSDTLGDLTIIGGASGVMPAAASLLRDLINISKGYKF